MFALIMLVVLMIASAIGCVLAATEEDEDKIR